MGLIFGIVMVALFFRAAPALSKTEVHKATLQNKECLKCHVMGGKGVPIMPHINLGHCRFCHK